MRERLEVSVSARFVLVLLVIIPGGAVLAADSPPSAALTNWQTAAATFRRVGTSLTGKHYAEAQATLAVAATNLPPPYARLAHQRLLELEAAFNRVKEDEPARLRALAGLCLRLHAYDAADHLAAEAQSSSGEADAEDDLLAWRLFETGKIQQAVGAYERKASENTVSTWREYYLKQVQLIRDRPRQLTNVTASLELVREHYLKGFEGKADLMCALRELNRVLPFAQSPDERLAVYHQTIQCLSGLNDENGRDAWEDRLLRDFRSNSNACAEVYLNRGIRAYLRKDYPRAVELFRKVCREYPDSESFGDAQYDIGSTLQEQRQYDQAVEEFSKLFTSNVDDYRLTPGTSEDYKLYRHKAALRISECYEAKKDYARALDYAELARTQYKPLSWCHTCLQTEKDALDKRISQLQQLAGNH